MKESHTIDPRDPATIHMTIEPSFEDVHCRKCPRADKCDTHTAKACQLRRGKK